jgi:beta-mannosidase
VEAALYADENKLDDWSGRIGLRTLTMRRKRTNGRIVRDVVNGVAIFAMGADYIPEDNILRRVTPERTRRLLEDARVAHFNAVRVWGGGYYPDDWFYDACDELGLVVWQDFMFACAVYELTPAFADNIRREVWDNVRRLRHHASLGLWCGNNEMEMFVDMGTWVSSPKQKADYIRMYEYIIPRRLSRWIRTRFTGRRRLRPAVRSTSRTTRTAATCITGTCGTATSRSRNTANSSSATRRSSGSSRSRA